MQKVEIKKREQRDWVKEVNEAKTLQSLKDILIQFIKESEARNGAFSKR